MDEWTNVYKYLTILMYKNRNKCSSLKTIFITALWNSKYVKFLGNYRIFVNLINEINDLENNRIELNFSSNTVKIYFSFGLAVGDNLGVNSVLGFSKSFLSMSLFGQKQ